MTKHPELKDDLFMEKLQEPVIRNSDQAAVSKDEDSKKVDEDPEQAAPYS